MLNDPDFILGAGSDTGVLVGASSSSIVALAGIGTAVALYPVVKRQNEALRARLRHLPLLEAAMIFIGVVSLLVVVTLRQDLGGSGRSGCGLARHHRPVARRDVNAGRSCSDPSLMPA